MYCLQTNNLYISLKFLFHAIKNSTLIFRLIAVRENAPCLEELLWARQDSTKFFLFIVIHQHIKTVSFNMNASTVGRLIEKFVKIGKHLLHVLF